MAFVEISGLKGKVFVPAKNADLIKKHKCRDCYSCQFCSDDRCGVCLGPKKCLNKRGCSKAVDPEN